MEDFKKLAQEYRETIEGIHLLNIQRVGLSTNLDRETVKLRAELLVEGKNHHKPLVNNPDSPYKIQNGRIFYEDSVTGILIAELGQDYPGPYYMRGDRILVVNSTTMNPCTQGCRFCEQTTALPEKRRYSLVFKGGEVFDKFLRENDRRSLVDLSQISIVTSCAGSEEGALNLINGYIDEARERGFNGRFLFATHEITSEKAIRSLDDNIILAFTVECFENRREIMPSRKGEMNLDEIRRVLSNASQRSKGSTYFYIFGLDSLNGMKEGFLFLRDSINIAPTGPNYQQQGNGFLFSQKDLEYFLRARQIYYEAHKGLTKFESVQNYRSLWPLEDNGGPVLIE